MSAPRGEARAKVASIERGRHDVAPVSVVEVRRAASMNAAKSAGSYRTAAPIFRNLGGLPAHLQRRNVLTLRPKIRAASVSFTKASVLPALIIVVPYRYRVTGRDRASQPTNCQPLFRSLVANCLLSGRYFARPWRHD